MTTITSISGKHYSASEKEDYKKYLEEIRSRSLEKFSVFKPGEMLLVHRPVASSGEHVLVEVPVATWQDIDDPQWVSLINRSRMMDTYLPGCYPVMYLEPYLDIDVSPRMHLMAKILAGERAYICREDHLVKMPEHFKTMFSPQK